MNRSISMVAAVCLLAGLVSSASAAIEPIEPAIPPGYEPTLDRDEQGMWMEMEEFEAQLRGSPLLVRDPGVNEYVYSVACRVAGDYCPDLRVYVVRNPGFNASMAPNGMMLVWSGLLLRVSSEDELASILGHEVAHYAMAHSLAQFRRLKTSLTVGSIFSLGVGAVTGVYAPVGESVAILDALGFSREHEREADLLGAQFMSAAGYDVHACAMVWENLLEEEEHAVVKRDKTPQWLSTHPASESRAEDLRSLAEAYGYPERDGFVDRHALALSSQYLNFMEDQIDTNRYGRTAFMLDRHESWGVRSGLVEFFRGEMYRQRADEGDSELAQAAYERAVESGECPASCYRNLGYIQLKAKDLQAAQDNFRRYLKADPEASDREMIEFYLAEEP
jgi:predicted Zn-dependent protease